MFPFSHGILEFQAMVAAGLSRLRALQAATSVAAEMLGRDDLGVLRPGACADIVAMPGNPLDDIAATARVDFVMRRRRLPPARGRRRGGLTGRPAPRPLRRGQPSGGRHVDLGGPWSCRTSPTGQVIPLGPWLQYPSGFLCRYCWW